MRLFFWHKRRPVYQPPAYVAVTLRGGPLDGKVVQVMEGSRRLEVPYLLPVDLRAHDLAPLTFGRHVYRQVPEFEYVEGEG